MKSTFKKEKENPGPSIHQISLKQHIFTIGISAGSDATQCAF